MDFLIKYSWYIVWIPFAIGTIKIKTLSRDRQFLYLAVILAIIGEKAMAYGAKTWMNNMPVLHIYTLLEFFLLFSVFYYGKKGIISFKLYKAIIIIFTSVGILNMIFFQGIMNENSISRSLEGIVLITFSLIFFYQILKDLEIVRPEKSFMFWFSIAILIYFSGNLLVFIYSNHLQNISKNSPENTELIVQIWVINYILNIIFYLLYTVAFLCKEQKPFPKSSLSAP